MAVATAILPSLSVPQCHLQERAFITCWAVLFWMDTVIPLTNRWDPIADPRAVGLIFSIETFLLSLIQSAAYERDRVPSPFREHKPPPRSPRPPGVGHLPTGRSSSLSSPSLLAELLEGPSCLKTGLRASLALPLKHKGFVNCFLG